MSLSSPDASVVLEAAYDLRQDQHSAMRRVLQAMAPALDHGLGLAGMPFRVTETGAELVSAPAVVGDLPQGYAALFDEALGTLSPELVESSWACPLSLDTQSAALARAFPEGPPVDLPWMERSRAAGAADNLVAKMVGPDGRGCLICAPLPAVTRVAPEDEARWRRIMTHVLAAFRLRDGLADREVEEAVLEPDGRVVHATSAARTSNAREALRDAALAVDGIRSGRAGHPDEVLDAWRGLVSGRWSLVDRFDRDGRRFLVALRNDPPVLPNPVLSLRERQVAAYVALGYPNKHIAYALGLAESTVSTHLRGAMRKLRLSSTAELAQLFVAADPPELA